MSLLGSQHKMASRLKCSTMNNLPSLAVIAKNATTEDLSNSSFLSIFLWCLDLTYLSFQCEKKKTLLNFLIHSFTHLKFRTILSAPQGNPFGHS